MWAVSVNDMSWVARTDNYSRRLLIMPRLGSIFRLDILTVFGKLAVQLNYKFIGAKMQLRKQCTDCHRLKDLTEFHVNRSLPGGLHYYCKDCQNRRGAEWRARDPEHARAIVRKSQRKTHKMRTYGLTNKMYEDMIVSQNGKCPICLKALKRPSVDHCHSTGKIRGVLCRHCNSSISVFDNDPEAVERMVTYLGITTPL
jgi:hypothetical protein